VGLGGRRTSAAGTLAATARLRSCRVCMGSGLNWRRRGGARAGEGRGGMTECGCGCGKGDVTECGRRHTGSPALASADSGSQRLPFRRSP
jgi:hypothetical protein